MDKYTQLLQEYVNASYEDLLARARFVLPDILTGLNNIAKDCDGTGFLLALVGTTVVADGMFSDQEYHFLSDVLELDISYKTLKNSLEQYCEEGWDDISYRVMNSVDEDTRTKLGIFCICLAAVDERISGEENGYIAALLS